MSEQLIDAYIEYLRNVSRKIISKAGFENIFPDITKKRNHYYTYLDTVNPIIIGNGYLEVTTDNMPFYKRLKAISDYLEIETEYKLFIGSGLIIGDFKNNRKSRYVCAPLFYCPIELDFEDRTFTLEFEKDSIQLNQDLLSRVFDIVLDEEIDDEFGNSNDYVSKFNNIEILENKYADNLQSVLLDSSDFMTDLIANMNDFRNIQISDDNFDIKKKSNDVYRDLEKPIYFNHTYFFVNRVPHELSSYEALNTLLRNEKPLKNKLLNKLFINVLTDKKTNLATINEVRELDIIEILNRYIPLTLSENQKTAIKKAWTSELSYIQGPPGTGKSYTICALILSAIFLNKKILFVSHKEAAVKIVKDMIDNLLGKESLLYLGSHISSKKRTKEYLDSILKEAESFKYDLYNNKFNKLSIEIENHKKDIERLYKAHYNLLNKISDFIEAENEYYRLHEEFIKRRFAFSSSYNVPNIEDYKWTKKQINRSKYLNSIKKYANSIENTSKNRLDILYISKFLKHFVNNFGCELKLLKRSTAYSGEMLELHSAFSDINKLLNIINKHDLNSLRNEVSHFEGELNRSIKLFLPKYQKYILLEKLIGEDKKDIRDEISAFKGMLHFKRASILQDKIQNLDYNNLTNIFPLWCSELRDLGRTIDLESELFDLVVVDEASQVNISEIIPAFYRAKQICVVGDKNQLNLNATGVGFALSKTFDKLSWQNAMVKYEGVISYETAKDKNIIVTQSSILDFVSSETNDFTIPTTMLNEHFRSFPSLAKFTSKAFYEDKWLIMTENGENVKKTCFKSIKVDGVRDTNKKFVKAEINTVNNLLYNLRINGELPEFIPFKKFKEGKPFTIGILSFLTNQVSELRNLVESNYDDLSKKHNIFVATPEEFQGNERDIMIITFGLDGTSSWGKAFYENPNRFNVATSRAKYFTYAIYAGLPHNIDLISKYLSEFGITTDSYKDSVPIISSKLGWKFDPRNLESNFEHKVFSYLEKYKNINNPDIEIYNQVTACGQKRLDFVLFNPRNDVTCAVEVDGKDHFVDGSYNYNEAHINRMSILKRAGWKIINLKYYNWWDNGWLCDENILHFKNELEELTNNLDVNLNH